MNLAPEYCVTMARYNAWQNKQMKAAIESLPEAELTKDRGAFFGSILATANHLLWGDRIWMSRFSDEPAPEGGINESVGLCADANTWALERFRTDARILMWAERLDALDLTGDLHWYSGALGREVEKPLALCVMHFFNHQTHHRGQIHTMLTAAGANAPVSDLFIMPETGPWL